MSVAASTLFDFIERHPVCMIDRCEFDMFEFGMLRRNVRQMVTRLRESGDLEALELSERLRCLLSNWLTAPVPFDESLFQQLSGVMGTADRVGTRWGRDIRELYIAALQASHELAGKANPLRETLQEVITKAMMDSQDFQIFCHKAAADYFLPLAPLNAFLHSATSYRNAEPFDLLIKVGPLRSRGWGSAPDALLSAPRFSKLVQLVWGGCADEEGFGYDPVVALASAGQKGIRSSPHRRELTVTRTGSSTGMNPDNSGSVEDEFQIFSSLKGRREVRQATLVQIEDENGMLYPPLSSEISFDSSPDAEDPIAKRLIDRNLCEGMFLVRHANHDPSVNEVHAEHGYFSRIWKVRLQTELDRIPEIFCGRLRTRGIDLENLYSAARHWSKSPTTVIHAPQKRSHFEILIRELGIEQAFPAETVNRGRGVWWQRAWSEIAASRGIAIQAGVQGQEVLEGELLATLKLMLPEIRQHAIREGNNFLMIFPDNVGLNGIVFFDRIVSIERGFKAPDNELRVMQEIGNFEQWRA
jgi:hypothetical protein